MNTPLVTRNATLPDLAKILKEQNGRKLDLIVPATAIRSEGGLWVVQGSEAVPGYGDDGELGMVPAAGTFRPTDVADEQVAQRLGVPAHWLKTTRATRPDIYDDVVNGLLHGGVGPDGAPVAADARSFMLRTFSGDTGGVGVARTLLSDRYGIKDNFDMLVAVLRGIERAEVETEVVGCDLTDRRMRVRIKAPQVQALAPVLLEGYRSPYNDRGSDQPVVFAGFEFSNSEVGDGAWSIVPRLIVQICTNGMRRTVDAVRAVHLGGKREAGIIVPSHETELAELAVMTHKATDAVAAFCDVDYMTKVIRDIEGTAATPIADPAAAVEVVTKRLKISEAEAATVLDHFIRGGQVTAGGVGHAITSMAQEVTDGDRAAELEGMFFEAVKVAASVGASN